MSPGEDRKILTHNRFEKTGHKLIIGNTLFLQTVDISLSKDTAFSSNVVKFYSIIPLFA